jgi:hypothetical protein
MIEAPIPSDATVSTTPASKPILWPKPREDMLIHGLIAEEVDGSLRITDLGRQMLEAHRRDEMYLQDHLSCHSLRWTWAGATVTHCGSCCPPPPLAPGTLAKIAHLLEAAGHTPATQLMHWRLRLFCGHVIDYSTNPDRRDVSQTSGYDCPVCGATGRIAVAVQPVGVEPNPKASDLPVSAPRGSAKGQARRTRGQELEEDNRRLRAEVEALRERLSRASPAE